MAKYYDRVVCSKETKETIMEECVKIFLKHHPEMKGIKITQEKIMYEISRFYITAP